MSIKKAFGGVEPGPARSKKLGGLSSSLELEEAKSVDFAAYLRKYNISISKRIATTKAYEQGKKPLYTPALGECDGISTNACSSSHDSAPKSEVQATTREQHLHASYPSPRSFRIQPPKPTTCHQKAKQQRPTKKQAERSTTKEDKLKE